MGAFALRRRGKRTGGAALILTLGMLVLLTGLILAFLVMTRSEYLGAKGYEGETNARLLTDSAVNLVIGQIREASTQPDLAWISQPGLIRTFDVKGAPVKSYKLYSADSLIEDGSFNPAENAKSGSGDLPPAFPAADSRSWEQQPGLWTNLNAPVADLTRTDPFDPAKKRPLMVYPIFDGNHINSTGQLSLNKDSSVDVEGFKVDDYATRGVAMPVKWLYLLKDGTLVSAKASGTAGDVEVLVPTGHQQTAQGERNSVVARVAFWTDDETSKVNINTASEGTFWDTPLSNGQPGVMAAAATYASNPEAVFEWDLADRQGAQKEYQRYPGHPATTCLSPIFGRQLLLLPSVNGDRAKMAEEIFKFSPRVSGAEYESADTTYINPTADYSSLAGTARAGGGMGDLSGKFVTPDGDRLYSSIDEFLYNPKFGTNARLPWRLALPATNRNTTGEMLEMGKFFITASSKAPEQNLFNLPRIAIWPEQVEVVGKPSRRTAFDKLIAFCSTLGPKDGSDPSHPALPFYFTRQNGDSATVDLSARNLELMNYLKGLTARPVPGWDTQGAAANTFADKYQEDRNQILTLMFDYVRCTNLADRSEKGVDSSYTQSLSTGAVGYFARNPLLGQSTLGQVVPIEMPDGTRGIGRIATVSELALVVVMKGPGELPEADQTKKTKLQVVLLPKLFSPMAGFCDLSNNLRLSFEDIEITLKEKKSGSVKKIFQEFNDPRFTKQPTMYDIGRVGTPVGFDSKVGGTIGWNRLCEMNNGLGDGETPMPAPLDSAVPNADVVVSSDPENTLTFQGTVTLKISAPAQSTPMNSMSEPVIQTIRFRFPEQEVPMPVASPPPDGEAGVRFFIKAGTGTGSNDKGITGSAADANTSRWYAGRGVRNWTGITSQDTVRSLAFTGKPAGSPSAGLQGDLRLIAARKDISADYFAPYNPTAYAVKTERNAGSHGLRHGFPLKGSEPGAIYGRLVEGMTGYLSRVLEPDLPAPINGVRNILGQAGDWDTGPFLITDGAYCNKPDEGSTPQQAVQDGDGDDWDFKKPAPYLGDNSVFQDVLLESTTFFSPNRMIPSAVMFGSLPTGVKRNYPWQTLLFRPAKYYLPGGDGQPFTATAANRYASIEHPGSGKYGPSDHLLLDLFWMPIVEPYAISEPFATAGKINLNHQIVPFTNIRRDTGIRAVLKSVKITAMNPDQKDLGGKRFIETYKLIGNPESGDSWGGPAAFGVISRRSIDLDNTLRLITDRLDRNKPFISASEICDIPLIPKDVPIVANLPSPMQPHVKVGIESTTPLAGFDAKLKTFWDAHKLTGDNGLEKPYALIYPRLTTRSNSFTVHVRVQTLAQNVRNSSFIIRASQNQPTGEFRGSFLIERYLDANSAGLIDSDGKPAKLPASGDATGLTLGPYRFRVVSSKQFSL